MKNKLEEILFMLRRDFEERQNLIEKNIKEIERTPPTQETIEQKMKLDNLNRSLIKRNEGNVELQNAISKYAITYLNLAPDANKSLLYDECLQLTIRGDMEYNPINPYFFDDNFYLQLLEHFIEIEDYDKCVLIKRKRTDVLG